MLEEETPNRRAPLDGAGGLQGLGGGESWEGGVPGCRPCGGSAAFLQAEAVEEVLAKAARGPLRPPGQAPQVGDVVSQRLDGLYLLVQVVGLEEVAELWGEGHQPGLGELHREGDRGLRGGRGLRRSRDPQGQLEIPREAQG